MLQGALSGAENHFLVTLPINRRSEAWFSVSPSDCALRVIPARKHKSRTLARGLLRHFGAREMGVLRIESELPEGKGLASSSADCVATARAVCDALGISLDLDILFDLLRGIEPTDGVMFDGIVAFLHRKVRLLRRFGRLPRPFRIVAIDEGGEVDTLSYNRHSRAYTPSEHRTYQALLEQTGEAFSGGNLAALGRIATRSAMLNQRRNPLPHLEDVLALKEQFGALGVAVTHSGSFTGLLFDSAPHQEEAVKQAREALQALSKKVWFFETVESPLVSLAVPRLGGAVHRIPARQTPSYTRKRLDEEALGL